MKNGDIYDDRDANIHVAFSLATANVLNCRGNLDLLHHLKLKDL